METTLTETTEMTETIATAATQARGFAEQTRSEQAWSLLMFGFGAVASGLFLYYLFTNPARLSELWEWTRSLNLLFQGLIWLVFLPWMICLWIWVMPWALPVRLVLVVGGMLFANWLLWPFK